MADDARTLESSNRDEIADALRVAAGGNQEQAINALRPLADAGDVVAAIPLTQYLWSSPAGWIAGMPYARQVAAAGIPYPFLANYVNNALNEPAHRDAGLELARDLLASGFQQLDLLGPAQTTAAQGDNIGAVRMLETSALPSALGAGRTWQQLLADAQQSLGNIKSQEVEANTARENAVTAIAGHENAIGNERERVEQLVAQVVDMVHDVSSHELAKQYAKQADDEARVARRYTTAALVIGGLTAVVALVVAGILVFGHHDAENVLQKASLTLPFLGFAVYVGKLAADHRRMAWHWRHVELQIRTADPFIAPLDDAPRKALLAALALRLFPGQPADPQRGGDEAPDPSEFLTALAKPSAPTSEP